MDRVLIIRMSAFGDVAMAAPVIASAVHYYPDVSFSILTREGYAPIFEPIIGLHVLALDIDKDYKRPYQLPAFLKAVKLENYDKVIDLHGVLRSQAITSVARLKSLSTYQLQKDRSGRKAIIDRGRDITKPLIPVMDLYIEVFREAGYDLPELIEISEIYTNEKVSSSNLRGQPYHVGIAPFAKYVEKTLPTKQVLRLMMYLHAHNIRPYIVGGGQKEYLLAEALAQKVDAVNMIGMLNLADDLSFIQGLDLMVAMDSANTHLARLVGTSTICIWGATHPAMGFGGWGMTDDDFFQLPADQLDCRPCSVFGNKSCKRGDLACLNRLDITLLGQKIINRLKVTHE